jgi:phosphoribosylaminoimidazolecarboxamide formyltransferase/IMP cyclohydrolase
MIQRSAVWAEAAPAGAGPANSAAAVTPVAHSIPEKVSPRSNASPWPQFGDHARRHGVSYIAGPDGSIGARKVERACQAHGVTLARSGPGLFHH